jgi:branched-chain amino acid transport system permease protein
MDWVNTIVQGALVGGLYALFAAGLSLMFGVMRLVNIAHGDLIVLAAYLALVVVETLGLTPFVSLVVVVPAMFLLGYILQRGLLNFTLGGDILPPLLVTFGLSIIIQNALLEGFSADSQKLSMGSFETASIQVTDQLAIGWFPATIFVTAVVVIALLEWLLYNTALGRAFRATSDDADTARLYGVRNRHIFSLATALALAVISIAAIFLAVRTTFGPASGPARLLFAFEAVIIGGLGSLWGTLAGGVVLGVAQSIGAQLNPGWETLAGHVAFLFVLIIRPRGLFPKLVD